MNLRRGLLRRGFWGNCLIAVFLAGCSAQTAPLPPPAISITHAAPTTARAESPEAPTPGLPNADSSPHVPNLLELAAREYGPRLILEVEIPAIDLSSPVVAVGWVANGTGDGRSEIEWDSPEALAGWVVTSALPGDGSNIVLYGHNNLYASVFRDLGELRAGDEVSLKTGADTSVYEVSKVLFLKIAFAGTEAVGDYEQYLRPTPKEQLTIISCWPPESNTHRVVVIAEPVR